MGTGTATQATSAKIRQFSCVHCSSSFSTRTELVSHVNQKHRTIKCQDCDKMFVLAADRDNHWRDVHTHPRHSCDAPQCRSSRSTAMSSTNTRETPTGTSLGLDVVLGHVIMSSKIGIRDRSFV